MTKLQSLCAVIFIAMTTIIPAVAQNLTARQMNIYFGSPKRVTSSNSQGTTVTEFDRMGRVTSVKQGNMSISYEWDVQGNNVTLSMYQGVNIKDHAHIEIVEDTPSKLKYIIGNMMNMEIIFKENGAIKKCNLANPQMSGSMVYYYKYDNDVYPSAIEQRMGSQSMKLSVTINDTDSYGNAIVYTQELMGNKDVTRLTIEYY